MKMWKCTVHVLNLGGECSSSDSSHFTSRKRTLVIHFIGDWVGPRAILDAVEKRNNPCACQESKLFSE
jgi:hypothetical protein